MDITIKSFTRKDKKGKISRVKTYTKKLKQKASAKPKRKGKLLGAGKNGRVFDLGNSVIKEKTKLGIAKSELRNLLGADEVGIQKRAAKIGVAPKIKKSGNRDSWIVMEKVRGETLSKKLPKSNERVQKSIGVKTGKTFKKLHAKGIIHNDSHLENIYTTKRGKTVVIDYGLSRYRNRPLKRKERLKDYQKLRTRSKQYPVFVDGFEKGYGKFSKYPTQLIYN
jgi:tRNA A-37 threonylcarbamoyl transferase component Bud32